MLTVHVLDNISKAGLDEFPVDRYQVGGDLENPDALLLRSSKIHDLPIGPNLKAVGRAGAGVNNIPVARLGEHGVPVFNTPGANANAVKELVLAGLLMTCRNLVDAVNFTTALADSGGLLSDEVERGKKQFAGQELPGKTIGIVGLGAIGRSVADVCTQMGMGVIGFDPMLTVEGAWQLRSSVTRAQSLEELWSGCDFVSFHVPLSDATRHMINADSIRRLRKGVTLLNFARSEIIDEDAVLEGICSGMVSRYVTDFPTSRLIESKGVIALPHLGASTVQAEENCARMIVEQMRDFLENGNIRNSVNFPEVVLPRGSPYRVAISNSNVPNMVGQISTAMAEAGLNIHDMINQSRGALAYTLVDSDSPISDAVVQRIQDIDGVLAARLV